LGTGFDNPLGPTAQFLMIFLLPAFYAFIGYLIVMGGILAVYIPLIPYVVFTFGAIGWLISVVEAMVAGPLVALGIISPSGQHELLGKAEPALMLIFNIFLRPSLMIFGLIAALLMASVVMTMINTLFWPVVFVRVGLMGGLLSIFMIMGAYVMLAFAALNKVFSAINVIPQQVMRWISGQGEQVETPLDQIKGGVEKVGGEATGGVRSAGGSADKSVKMQQKQQAAEKGAGKDIKTSGESSDKNEPK
jgi:conjugal transfer/type IV secretion protein DotA/TraY